jgi:hypothetical protein
MSSPQPSPGQLPPAAVMMHKMIGFWHAKAIHIAAKLGIADYLVDGPKSAPELATATNTNTDSLFRLLRALSSIGIFEQRPDGSFALNDLASTLRSDIHGSLRATAVSELNPAHYDAWGDLGFSIETGGIAFDKRFGMPVWEYHARNADEHMWFQRSMSGIGGQFAPAIIRAYDFSPFRRIGDIGGGNGSLLAAVLHANPAARGIVQDLPEVIDGTRKALADAGVADRAAVYPASFFDVVVPGCDLYMMRWIIHDWEDAKALAILKNVRAAMAGNSRLVLAETIVTDGPESMFPKFMDLNMMVMVGGKERTVEEFRALLAQAGLELTQVVQTGTMMSVIEAVPFRS